MSVVCVGANHGVAKRLQGLERRTIIVSRYWSKELIAMGNHGKVLGTAMVAFGKPIA